MLALENVDHLFGECYFFIVIWNVLMLRLQVYFKWESIILENNLLRWKDVFLLLMDTPFATMWDIWRARNLATF